VVPFPETVPISVCQFKGSLQSPHVLGATPSCVLRRNARVTLEPATVAITVVPVSVVVFWTKSLRTTAPAVGTAETLDRPRAGLEEWRERTEWSAAVLVAAEFEDVCREERLLRIPSGSRWST
jgi:hypothetical protein